MPEKVVPPTVPAAAMLKFLPLVAAPYRNCPLKCHGAQAAACQSKPTAPSAPQLGFSPSGPAKFTSLPPVPKAPPSIHQVQVSLATGAGGAFIGIGLFMSAAPALGAAAANATTEAPARR